MKKIEEEILNKIREYDSIVLCRHFRPDGDAIGSTKGLMRILSLSFPEKKIYLTSSDYSDYLSFLGGDDGLLDEKIIASSLAIVLDTATMDRVSNKAIFLAKEMIKIDHHIKTETWNAIEWIEDGRSSTCEMIAQFYSDFSSILKIDSIAATAIYCGMVTDSGRFSFSSTSPRTLRLASVMLEKGVDVETLQARLDLKELSFYRYREAVFNKVKFTENGLGWVYVDSDMQEELNLSREEASESVSFMANIKGVICWLAFIDNGDGTIRVRLRSRFMTVDKIANRYHGGGHDRASGATCYSIEEMNALIEDCDKAVKEYKENNEGWM